MSLTLDDLRRFALARSLFLPTTLERALETFGFVQADPIRGNVSVKNGALHADLGYIAGRRLREPRFAQGLEAELERLRVFLNLAVPFTPSVRGSSYGRAASVRRV